MFELPSKQCDEFTVTLSYAKQKIDNADLIELKRVG